MFLFLSLSSVFWTLLVYMLGNNHHVFKGICAFIHSFIHCVIDSHCESQAGLYSLFCLSLLRSFVGFWNMKQGRTSVKCCLKFKGKCSCSSLPSVVQNDNTWMWGNTAAVQPLSPAAVITAVYAHLPEQENETIRYSSVFILSPFLQNPILGFFPFL